MTVLILIPCKSLDQGKSRLKDDIDTYRRRIVCEFFLHRTLILATSIVGARHIRVITMDPEVMSIAGGYSIQTIADRGGGLNSALSDARTELMSKSFDETDVLVLPTDLPFADRAVIGKMTSERADVVIAPDQAAAGTNLLFLKSGIFRNFTFAYGENSFAVHRRTAFLSGHRVRIFKDERLAFDVDCFDQYRRWLRTLAKGRDLAVMPTVLLILRNSLIRREFHVLEIAADHA